MAVPIERMNKMGNPAIHVKKLHLSTINPFSGLVEIPLFKVLIFSLPWAIGSPTVTG
jgi:hypothetical protein